MRQLALVFIVALSFLASTRAQFPAPQSANSTQSLTHGGLTRTYDVHDYSNGGAAPLVIVLHGGGGNAANAVRMTGWDRVASRERLIAVYPNGTANRPRIPLLTWNAGHCCAAAMNNRIDDVGFIGAIIDTLVAARRVDASRVYVTGMSNGAMMTHRLGRELASKIAAIAPVVGAVFGDEPPAVTPMPAFIIVGADDDIVPGAGGAIGRNRPRMVEMAADRNVEPAVAQAQFWARANGCGASVQRDRPEVKVSEWNNCRSGAPVVFNIVANNGHAWPGGEPGRAGAAQPTKAYDATEQMWAFFKAQRRTSS